MWNLPNKLTLLRIILIPVFALVYYLPISGSHIVAALIFALAAFTDWLDGFVARRMGLMSAFGAFLDPVADKLMVAVALVLLVSTTPGFVLAFPAAVIIGREITISALREWMANLGKRAKVAVSFIGKVKTMAQMAALVLLLYHEPIGYFDTKRVGILLLYLAALLTLWSMVIYLRSAWPVLSGSESRK